MELTEQIILMEKNERTLSAGDDKSLTVKFKLMSAETKNLNNRIYSRDILSKAVEGLKARIAKRRDSFAACGHKEGGGEVDDATAFLEDVEMKGDDVFATARVVPTAKGKNIITLLRNGAALGVSAKGRGEMDGNRVKPGFELFGFDWTLSPGFGTYASKANIIESVTVGEDDGTVSLQELEAMGLIDEPVTEAEKEIMINKGYNQAILSGFKGDMADYRASLNLSKSDRDAETKFDDAVKNSGYKGTLAQYRAALSIKK